MSGPEQPPGKSGVSYWGQLFSSQRREAKRVLAELVAMRGIMPLLMKARNGETWTAAEKAELLGHLRRMVHISPYLVFLLLPGSIFLLPAYAWWLDRRRDERKPGSVQAQQSER